MTQKWPKKLKELTVEQQRIKDDFMKYWHEVLPKKYGIIERFNHGFPVKYGKKSARVLEIGAGLGEHLEYEDISGVDYYTLELRAEMAAEIKKRFPAVNVLVGDCQKRIDVENNYFDKVIAIHVLEHLPDLPATIREVYRVLKPDGEFLVVIPCEGGLAYSLAREISAKRIFEKRYNTGYDWCIGSEHINVPKEIIEELKPFFEITKKSFFPLFIPSVSFNLVIGLVLKPKNKDR